MAPAVDISAWVQAESVCSRDPLLACIMGRASDRQVCSLLQRCGTPQRVTDLSPQLFWPCQVAQLHEVWLQCDIEVFKNCLSCAAMASCTVSIAGSPSGTG